MFTVFLARVGTVEELSVCCVKKTVSKQLAKVKERYIQY